MQQSPLLAVSHAGRCVTKGGVAAVADFDEHPGLTITHDEIELTPTYRHVGSGEGKPGALQVLAGLDLIARSLGALTQETGTTEPWRYCSQVSFLVITQLGDDVSTPVVPETWNPGNWRI